MSESSNFARKRRKYVKASGRYLLRKVADYMGRHSLLGDKPFFDTSVFPWFEDFEANWEKIRAELDQVLETQNKLPTFHEISPDQERISTGDNWKTFGFYVFGDRFDSNCERHRYNRGLVRNSRIGWHVLLTPCTRRLLYLATLFPAFTSETLR
jgi:aspartyl/asparaginyl beta-hydroxylase (cupin superfamily)